jgi:MtN3 and saliva related transmembrane protein
MEWYLIGSLAALLTTFGFLPQIIKMIRTKSVKDISIITFLQFSLGVFLWAIYGIHIGDTIVVIANICTLLTLLVAITLYYHYKKIETISDTR